MDAMVVRLTGPGDRPFVGRRRELAVAARILSDGDRAGVVLIGGESGQGKTRLVEEIIADAPAETTVIRAVAVPRATSIPFELIRSVLDVGSNGPPADSVEPANRVQQEAEALRSLAAGATIFVFEDVHWSDPESLDVVDRLLVAGPLGASVLITYRPNALHPDHPTSSFLQRAERRSHVVQFRLEPLRREEVGEYLESTGRRADRETVDHVHGRTGGNPLLLSELVAATDEDADLTTGLPWTLAEMLRPEIDRLPQAERQVAEAVAVLGTAVEFDILAAAVTVTEDDLIDRLRFLVDRGILLERGPDRFGFRHDMVREAVAESLFAREHRRIHAAVHDRLLADGSSDVVALVAHATGAGRTKQAADAARDAAREAFEDGRTHQAVSFAEQALLEHGDDLDLLRIVVVAAWMTAQYRTALHHLDRWDELVGVTSSDRAEVLHHRVRLLWERGDGVGADAAADELAELADTLPPGPVLVQALADQAQHQMLRDRVDVAMAVADRAIAVGAEVGPPAASAVRQARAERASALATRADRQTEAVTELLAVAQEATAADDHLVASRALHNVPLRHPLVEPRAHIEQMRRAASCAGLSSITNHSYRRSLLILSEMEGDRESNLALIESALDNAADWDEAFVYGALSALESGDTAEARRLIERLPGGFGGHHTDGWSAGWRAAMLSLVDLFEGNVEPARQWLTEPQNGRFIRKFNLARIPQYLSSLLDAGLAAELTEVATDEPFATSTEPFHMAIRAELTGDRAGAEANLRTALASDFRRSVTEVSEIHLALARLAGADGGDQRIHLEAAAAALSCWPGRRLAAIEARLGTQTAPDAPPGTEAPGGLTPREREVATLVARGLTNGGIAEELFISTKTASVHVSNILAKLTMSSRSEIAGWVGGGGLEAAP